MANGIFGGGTGTALDPYLIEDAQDFNALYNKPTLHYKLVADIDFSTVPLVPLTSAFTGVFDGDGFTVSNYTISANNYSGLIPILRGGIVKNLVIRNAKVSGTTNVSILTGNAENGSIIENVHIFDSSIEVSGSNAGGVCGYTTGLVKINNCSFQGKIEDKNTAVANVYIGGICGKTYGGSASPASVISNCSSKIEIISSGGFCGGLVGASSNTSISSSWVKGTISTSKTFTTTDNTGQQVGGLVGNTTYTQIDSCFSNVNINLPNAWNSGGFIGGLYVGTEISNCYAHGSFIGNLRIGGFIGYGNGGTEKASFVKNSYSTVAVTATSTKKAFACYVDFRYVTFTNCYCDTEATKGSGDLHSTQSSTYPYTGGIEGKTTAEMKNPTTFSAWDTDIWRSLNNMYPKLFFEKLNKTLILFRDGYKKWNEGSSAADATYSENSIIPKMTSNTAPSGRAFASSIFSDLFDAWYAFDKTDNSEGWVTANGTLIGYVGYDFGAEVVIGKYSVRSGITVGQIGEMPKNWVFEGSNDSTTGSDGTWSTLDERNNQTWTTAITEKEYIIPSPKAYKMYRLRALLNNGSVYYVGLNELKMFKLVSPTTPASPSSWQTISTTLPSADTFKDEGMDDLSVFDRKSTIFNIPMDDNGVNGTVLGKGKVFKEKIDLKKYFDIKSINVK